MTALTRLVVVAVLTAAVGLSLASLKLNERRILLPFNNGVATNFTLEATNNNCYQWSSSRVEVANVEPLDQKKACSSKALVTVVSTTPKRQSTVVTATDSASGSVIRCDVEIDVIDSTEIVTTTKEIVLEDLPEILEVKAKNIRNDTFTSIGGVQFEWTLSPVDVLRYRTWSSTAYISRPYANFWESREAKGPAILVEGIRTGSAKVIARIVGEDYKQVKPAEIVLQVIANINLVPRYLIYLLRGSKVHFRAEMAKQNSRVDLQLPSPQYYLKVLDPTVARLDEANSQVEALKEDGHTSILLLDRNVEPGQTTNNPTTEIHVMSPSYISIHVTPGENWALCEFTNYAISFTIHDVWHHRLYPADNLLLQVKFSSRFFHINESTINGTHHTVRTINSGNTKITAELLGAGSAKLAVPLKFTQEVAIYRSLTLTPYIILLPWIPAVKPSYTVYATADGATGQYRWVSNNTLLATVSYQQDRSSRVTIVTRGEGEALISCQDIHNSVFSANLRTSIRPMVDIETLPAVLETHIGGTIIIPIAVYGYESDSSKSKRLFDDCSQIPFEVEIIEKTRVRYDSNNLMAGLGTKSCRSLVFECIATGNTRVWIRYKEDGKELLSTTALIGCHLPLKAVHPEEVAVMPLGGIIDVAFEGGPRPWSLHPEGHYTKLSFSEPSIVSSTEVVDRYRYNKDLHVFRVKCLQYGETELHLDVGNLATATLPNPASAKAQVKVACARPSSLIIRPKLKSSCPLSAPQDSVFPIEKNQNPEIEVEVRDDSGRSFYNISTLNIVWKMEGKGTLETQNGIKEIVNGAKGYFAITKNIQTLREMRSNSVKIAAEIYGYKKEFKDYFRISNEIELISVDKAKVDQDNVAILNHPDQKSVVNIQRGSGYFSIDSESERQFISISFKQQSKSFSISPKAIGSGVIEINDLCLTYYGPTEVHYSVVIATDIRIDLVDKFQLGTTAEGFLSVIDNNGDFLHSSNHKLIDLWPKVSNRILNISNLTVFDDWRSVFKVKGEALGSSSMSWSSRSSLMSQLESPSKDIQVFAPLHIVPSNLTLIVGDYFQVMTSGGPQPMRNIEFSLSDESLAKVDPNGLIVGFKLGKTKLIARVLSVDNVEYSRSEMELNVVALTKIKIVSPTSQLRVGSKLPLHLMGANEFENAFSFGTSVPSLRITWSVSSDNIALIEDVFQNSGVVDTLSTSVSVRIRGLTAGTVTVKVMVESKSETTDRSLQQILNNRILSDTIQINVFPSFAILLSDGRTIEENSILMSPNSKLPLQSNRIGEAESSFQLVGATTIKLNCGSDPCLKSGDSSELSSLVVKTNEKFGSSLTSVFSLRVDKISYLMVNPINSLHPEEIIGVFPIGSEQRLRVSFHDNIGKQFDSVRSQIRWSLSRNDLIRVSRGSENTTFAIKMLKEGRTLVKVFDTENNIFDIFAVEVGLVIEPNNPRISIGEVICFRTKLKTSKAKFWSVENPLIGSIDKESGMFVARSSGHTLVELQSTDGSITYTNIEVTHPHSFFFETKNFNGITNIMSQSIPISIENHSKYVLQRHCETTTELNSISIESPFSCEITFEPSLQMKSIWDVSVDFSPETCQWMCRFKPKTDINLAEMALINTNVTISATLIVRDSDSEQRPLHHAITAPFVPAFVVFPKQVILSLDQSAARISVHSVPSILKDLSIVSSNTDMIKVSKSDITDNSLKVLISLISADVFTNDVSNLHIAITSKTTKQLERIPIQIKLFRQNIQQVSPYYQILKDYTFIVMFTIFAAFSVYILITKFLSKKLVPIPLPSESSSPFLADFHSPQLKGHRALDYSPKSPLSPTPPRVGRPLYSVPKT